MTAEKVLAAARRELGTKESPANSNRVKYNTWYYGREVSGSAYPWCAVFVQWCFDQASVKLPKRTASGVLRLSFGPETTEAEIDACAQALRRHHDTRMPML